MRKWILSILIIFLSTFTTPPTLFADQAAIDQLKQQIDDRNSKIKALEEEINSYQNQLVEVGSKAKTLQNTITTLDLTRKKLTASINVTTNQITKTENTIQKLGLEIEDTEEKIGNREGAIVKSLQALNEARNTSLVENMLSSGNLSGFWDSIDTREKVQEEIRKNLVDLKDLKTQLSEKKSEAESNKKSLVSYQNQLSAQKTIADANRKEKATLLTETKNTEANYQKILAQKQAQKAAFEAELRNYEAKLQIELDPSRIPSAGSSPLGFPLDSPKLTQPFGDTDFSRANPFVYNGFGHNGVDFRASLGTPLKASADGVVKGAGNTDNACPGASYGKWVLIEHGNGLSTLYAHLSLFAVSEGQSVTKGQVIGYSGSTGYATGPHLHFTVYATQGVKIIQRASKVCGNRIYTLPVADLKAYLNPLLYLPPLP